MELVRWHLSVRGILPPLQEVGNGGCAQSTGKGGSVEFYSVPVGNDGANPLACCNGLPPVQVREQARRVLGRRGHRWLANSELDSMDSVKQSACPA